MLITLEEAEKYSSRLRSEGKKITFTNGCFDIIHAGHVDYLTKASKLGDCLFIGLNSDSSVKRLKGESRPINNELDRAAVLSALKPVDFVVIFDEDTPYELIKAIQPFYLVKGGDYKADDIVGADIVRAHGGEVVVLPYLEGRSTTSIINKIGQQ